MTAKEKSDPQKHINARPVIVNEELERAAKEWQATFDATNDAIWILDSDQCILRANKTAEKLFMHPSSELSGKHCWEIVHRTEAPISECPLLLSNKSLRRESMELQIGNRWFKVTVDPIIDASGRLSGAVHILSDITEFKRVEEALLKSEEKYRILVENSNETIIVIQNGIIRFINEKAIESFGYSKQELLSTPISEFIHPDDREQVINRYLQKIRGDATPTRYTYRTLHKSGQTQWIEISSALIDWEGRPATLNMISNITARKLAEETLLESEEKYRHLYINAPAGIYEVDFVTGRFTQVNSLMCEYTGYSREELLAKTPLDILTEESRCLFLERIEKIGRGESVPTNPEFCIRNKDGSVRWVQLNSKFIHRDGSITGASVVAHDITERRYLEDMIRKSEEKYRRIAENIADVVWIADSDFKVTYLSPSVEKMIGEPVEVNMKRSMEERFLPDSLNYIFSILMEEFEKEKDPKSDKKRTRLIEVQQYRADGTTFWVAINISFIRDKNGNPVGYQGVTRDISGRKKAEEELRESEARLRTLSDNLPAGLVYQIDSGEDGQQRRFTFISAGVEQLHEVTAAEAISDAMIIYNQVAEEDRYMVAELERTALADMEPFKAEVRVHLPSGKKRWSLFTSAPRRLPDNQLIWDGIEIDITDRKRAEAELLKAEKLESVGVLAGGIAHDFNNILTAIMGNISMARMKVKSDHKISDLLSAAEKASIRAQGLTTQLLTFAKGGMPIKEVALIADILKESSLFVLTGSKSRCEFQIAEDLWPVEADSGQISQVINNIVINANQAMPEGGVIQIRAENKELREGHSLPLKPGSYIMITIKDQGTGIAEKHLSKIFDPYFSTKQTGSGLGLATAYSVIRNHAGHISVNSKQGFGTTFYIYLPSSDKEIQAKAESALLKGGGKILVMDDDEFLKVMMGDMLEMLEYKADFAENDAEATALYRNALEAGKPYDAVILDLTIPGSMGGREVVKILIDMDPQVKAIVCSGYSEDPVMSNFREYGFKGMMPKPFDLQSLGKVLHDVLKSA